MPSRQNLIRALCGGVVAALTPLVMAGRAEAQKPPTPKPAPGSTGGPAALVDLGLVLGEYRKTAAFGKYRDRIKAQAELFSQEMQTLAELRYCNEAERKEGLALKAKARRNEKEEARLKELMQVADTVENEISMLSQKAGPTSEDTARLQALQKRRTDAIRALSVEEADRRDRIQQLENQLMEEVEHELLAHVEKVAKDRKIPVIYERRAVLFGGNDLTDVVMKRLPK